MIFVLLCFLAAACCFDYRQDRIPNGLVLLGLAAAVVCRLARCAGETSECGAAAVLAGEAGYLILWVGIVFAILYPFYMLGMLGAGDVKLYCMSAAFLRGRESLSFLAGSMLIAALAALVKLLGQNNLMERLGYFCSYCADILRSGSPRLYFEGVGRRAQRNASIHMAGPMLAGWVLCLCMG